MPDRPMMTDITKRTSVAIQYQSNCLFTNRLIINAIQTNPNKANFPDSDDRTALPIRNSTIVSKTTRMAQAAAAP